MKQFALLLMLAIIATSETIKPTDTCACDKILSENDCKNLSTCTWTAAVPATDTTPSIAGSCGVPASPILSQAHCPQVTEPATNCWKTLGCAYVDNKCNHFTGCSAYVKTTNSDCHAISQLCITDGTQCTDSKPCNEYTDETQCTTNASTSGTLKCKWDNNVCRDYVCTEADPTLSTNIACSNWLSGCVTTGKGCTESLGTCSSYIGDNLICSGLIGTDGNCEGVVEGTNCSVRICDQAPATLITDSDCNSYQTGCISTGKGCTTSPLPACATYLGDNIACQGYIGSDGTCEGDAGAINCRSKICTNAPISNITDILCSDYKTGCVTTGKGCVSSRGTCAMYSGTNTSCLGYIGSDGYCEGTNATTNSPCRAKVCTGAPTTTSTDAVCILYQLGCKTTGKGCIATLGPCSSYSGTTTTCEGFVGLDGKCKGVLADTDGPCTPKICSEAPSSISTNEACTLYQTGCVTNGSGCVAITGCLDTIKSISCQGTPGCGWNSICVANLNCPDFLTKSICNENNAIQISGGITKTMPCFWTGTQCKSLACSDAPTTHSNDSQCNTFLHGCLTNGHGCLDSSAPCTSYTGTRNTCSAFTRKCYNIEGASSSSPCTERVCSDDLTSTTNSACNTFKTGCITKGTGCIDPSKLCSEYNGTQSECDGFRGNNGQKRCWALSKDVSSSCIDKTCAHLASATSDSECDSFLSGCLFSGVGCVPKSSACNAYTGTQIECGNFKGTNKTKVCWSTSSSSGNCIEKDCSHAPTGTYTDSDCGAFLQGCLSTGTNCVPSSAPCSSYTGTLIQCSAFTGNFLKCYNKDTCVDRVCSEKLNPKSNDDCQSYFSSCRYFKSTCITAEACNAYLGDSLTLCQEVLDQNNNKCWWTSGSTCISRDCATAPSTVTNQSECDSHIQGCVYTGTNSCVIKGACSGYPANGTSATDKMANCKSMIDSNGKYCYYKSGNNCELKSCSNVQGTISGQSSCDAHISGCSYDGSTCVPVNSCVNYVVTGTDSEKLIQCRNLIDTNNKACWWVAGTNCSDRSCTTATSLVPTSQATCDLHIKDSCIHQSCLNLVCFRKTNATNNSDCTSHDSACRFNGNAICQAQQASCINYTIDSSINNIVSKGTICNALTDSNGGKCSYSGTGSNCRVRVCSDKTDAAQASDCINWLSKCRWIGGTSTCVDAKSDCTYVVTNAVTATSICEALTDSSSNLCQLDSGQNCKARACSDKTNAAQASDCTNWLSKCRWIGGTSTCVDAKSDCTYVVTNAVIATPICEALTDSSSNLCQLDSGQNCKARACSDRTNATQASDCTNWLSKCRWIGGTSTCVDAKSDCSYTVTYISAAQLSSQTFGIFKCVLDTGSTCKSGKCQELSASSFSECKNKDPMCIWVGGTNCKEWDWTCNYTIQTGVEAAPICESIQDISGYCQQGTGQSCTPRLCEGKTNANSQSDCTKWDQFCRWVGGTSCLYGYADCNYTVISGDPTAICASLTDLNGNSCTLDSGMTCKKKICSDKTDATQASDCTNWGQTCRWIGGTTACVEKNYNCAYTLTDGIDAAPLCESLGCVLNSGQTCKDRTCQNKTNASSASDCDNWTFGCKYVGGSSCVDWKPNCSYTIIGDAQKICLELGCQFSTGQTCRNRACSDITNATSFSDCTNWNSDCQWLGGSTCVENSYDCSYTVTPGPTPSQLCESLTDTSSNYCQLDSGQNCKARTCSDKTDATQASDCTNWQSSCRWVGGTSVCVGAKSDCTYTVTGGVDTSSICLGLTDSSSNGCQLDSGQNCKARICSGKTNATSNSDCNQWKADCQWTGVTTGQTCTDPDTCLQCKAKTCQNIPTTPSSNKNCLDWLSTCRYTGSSICIPEGICTTYNVSAGSDSANRTICEGIKNNSGALCAYINSATNCSERTCPLVPTVDQPNCIAWIGTSCRWDGTQCLAEGACNSYQVVGATDELKKTYCQTLTNAFTPPLPCGWSSGLNCTDRDCNILYPSPSTDSDCQTYLSFCRLTNTLIPSCIAKTSTCSQYTGSPAQCKTFKGTNDTIPCWSIAADGSTAASCIDKQCSHNTTATTNEECNIFLNGCKTNGTGCIPNSAACSTFEGNASTCPLRLSGDGISFCKVATSVSDACTIKSCYDDGESTTDAQYQNFMSTCLTKGKGCIPKTEPCSSYQGTQAACGAFTGNSKKCWNNAFATGTTFCVDRKCSDDLISMTDAACQSSLSGCVTKGVGCIEDSAACGAYQGTQATCSMFKGNKTTLCWNLTTATETTPCIEKACIHNISATSDSDCETFLPRATGATIPKCVTSGTGCIGYPRSCSGFTGTLEQCGKFTATDGPCKTTAKGSISASGTCTPRICSEALNSNNTDALCQAFHPTCVTTGYGCATLAGCSMIQEQSSCLTKTGCSWVNNCRGIEVDCSSFTASGASICVNTPVKSGSKKCSWYNNTCRPQICDDLSANLVSHDSCKAIIPTCTTTGSGCITCAIFNKKIKNLIPLLIIPFKSLIRPLNRVSLQCTYIYSNIYVWQHFNKVRAIVIKIFLRNYEGTNLETFLSLKSKKIILINSFFSTNAVQYTSKEYPKMIIITQCLIKILQLKKQFYKINFMLTIFTKELSKIFIFSIQLCRIKGKQFESLKQNQQNLNQFLSIFILTSIQQQNSLSFCFLHIINFFSHHYNQELSLQLMKGCTLFRNLFIRILLRVCF